MAYTPRLTSDGIVDNYHWYSDNPFYIAGYGMPNCTCYAWRLNYAIHNMVDFGKLEILTI